MKGEAPALGGDKGDPAALGILTGELVGDAATGVGLLELLPPKKGREGIKSHPPIIIDRMPIKGTKVLRCIHQTPPHFTF